MRSSAIRAFSSASRLRQHSAQVTANVTGAVSSIPAYIVPAHGGAAEQSTSEAYIDEQEALEPEESRQRRSQEARDGSARIGMVELPAELQLAVNRLIEGAL